jgi:hypothetical protein
LNRGKHSPRTEKNFSEKRKDKKVSEMHHAPKRKNTGKET